jgi:aldehyde:ferredoxin oxidoreductase
LRQDLSSIDFIVLFRKLVNMFGWNGKFLRVNLGKRKAVVDKYTQEVAVNFLGGRGFAAKILWEELKPGTDPLSPENKLILATGPLTGFVLPSSSKLVVAAKSPLTGGYGDGNLGTFAAAQMRKSGYDAVVIEGKSEKPTTLLIRDESTDFLDAKDLWGQNSFETERKLAKEYGRTAGVLCIGQAGENCVKYAVVVSQEGRAGGRPGIGAVMGSKNLKAVVFKGSSKLQAADPQKLKEIGEESYKHVLSRPGYAFWKRQGTMKTIEWTQENSVLPTHNYREGVFEKADAVGGFAAEKIRVSTRGCPLCNMTCGYVVEDCEGKESELDYENVAMLSANIGLGNLKEVAVLNRLADEYGFDSISLGNVLGFAMEASEKGLIKEKIGWGDFQAAKALTEDIAFRRGYLGNLLGEGVRSAAKEIGKGSNLWAMHVKGLEVSAYDCHTLPSMALAYGTSSIGAHHKDAWMPGWEILTGREGYGIEKVKKVIELQNLRSVFEFLVVCKCPWMEIDFDLEWYPKLLTAATGVNWSWAELNMIGERVFSLMRAFWIREYAGKWSIEMDVPPARWFEEKLTTGPFKGSKLDRAKYNDMLQMYYQMRGWDKCGIPKKSTLARLGLN